MSRKLTDLTKKCREEINTLLANCKSQGVEMRPYFTLRTPAEQAILWRQSRTSKEIKATIRDLKDQGAEYLASVLDDVGPQNGRPVTNALPGNSWHQWGNACDCFWLLDGNAEWSSRKQITLPDGSKRNGYAVYAETAEAQGITAGGHWRSFKDWPHVQTPAESSPQRLYSWQEIDEAMQKKFG